MSPSRILIVDDSDIARTALRVLLAEAGMQVFEQRSAISAARFVSRNEVDVALVDLGLPGLSGDKLVPLLRRTSRARDLVIIVVSGRPLEEVRRIASEAGADAALTKAQVQHELVDLLAMLDKLKAEGKLTTPVA